MDKTSVQERQKPLHPMPTSGVRVPVGVHRAVGGLHDAPTPGDLLCAALAACQDSTFRMIANIMNMADRQQHHRVQPERRGHRRLRIDVQQRAHTE